MSSDVKHLSARIGLMILAAGFTLLGLLALVNRAHSNMTDASVLEDNCCIIGGIISICAGSIFLVAAWVYWRRLPAVATAQRNKEQDQSTRAVTSQRIRSLSPASGVDPFLPERGRPEGQSI
jgi:hypothetical protein